MGDQDLGVLLEEGGDRLHRSSFGDQVQGNEAVGSHAQLDGPGGQQLRHIDAWPALDDLDVQVSPCIGPGRQGLIEATMLGLGPPVGGEADANATLFVDRGLGIATGSEGGNRRGDAAGEDQAAADNGGGNRTALHRPSLGLEAGQGKVIAKGIWPRRRSRPG